MKEKDQTITRRKFLKTAAAGVALGLVGQPSFSFAKEQYDLAVISGEPTAATKKALEAIGGISRFVKRGSALSSSPICRLPELLISAQPPIRWSLRQ